MSKLKFLTAALILLSMPVCAFGQSQVDIKGKVVDTSDVPVAGASVIVEGTMTGTITDGEGMFNIPRVAPGSTVTVSFIGYDKGSFVVTEAKAYYDVILAQDVKTIEDVVVVGFGTQKKVNLTGAVAQIIADDIGTRPGANLDQMLQGMVPGLNVDIKSGKPGSDSNFNIRGYTSPSGGSPLVLIDGVESYTSRINSNDIESISVLKDASSASIYGAKAAFGVILITTKSGKKNQKAQVSYDGYFAVSAPTTSTDYETRGYYAASIADLFMTSGRGVPYTKYTEADYQALWERRNDKTEHPDRPWVMTDTRNGTEQYVYLANFDWYNYLYDTRRPTHDHNVSISGGSDKMSYMVSGRLYSQSGIQNLSDDGYKSYNMRANLTFEVKPWLEIRSNTKWFSGKYTYTGLESESTNWRRPGMHALASFVPMNPDGTSVAYTSLTYSATHYPADGWVAMMQKGKTGGHNITQEMVTKWDFIFKLHKKVTFTADFGYKKGYLRNDFRSVPVEYSKYPGVVETLSTNYFDQYKESVYDQNFYTTNAYLNYKDSWGGHNLEIIGGFNYEGKFYRDLVVKQDDLLTEDLSDFNLAYGEVTQLDGGRDENSSLGVFYRAAYNYKERYLFEVNGRYDGSSKFLKGYRFGFFPSFSAAWRISEEQFMKPLRNTIDNLKLRLSYGTLGNMNNNKVGSYSYITSVHTDGVMNYSFDGATTAQYGYADAPTLDSGVTWEKVVHKNIGLDIGMFRSRLNITADAYIRDVVGVLSSDGVALPAIYGADAPLMNAYDTRTYGWEMSVNWRDAVPLGGSVFRYNIGASISDYKAKYLNTDNNPNGLINLANTGYYVGDIWGYRVDGLFASTAEAQEYAERIDLTKVCGDYFRSDAGEYGKGIQAGDMKYLDLNGDNIVNSGAGTIEDPGDMEVIGNSQPRYIYSINAGFEWYGFDLSFLLQGVGRQDWYPHSDNIRFWGAYVRPFASLLPRNFMSDVWSETNTDAYFPRPRAYAARDSYSMDQTNDRYIQNLAYMRLKNLTLGYTLPDRWMSKIGVEKLRVYFSGENLFYFTKLRSKFIDPEQATSNSGNSDAYPYYKTFSFGVNLTF